MRKKARVCPVLIERGGHIIKSEIVASDNEEPARISMRMRDKGWAPYRVRFDEGQSAWVVSTFDWSPPPPKASRSADLGQKRL
jgi:hypothetical protein